MSHVLRDGELLIRPFQADDAPMLHQTVRASLASLSYWFPWCGPSYSRQASEAWVAHCRSTWAAQTEFSFGIFEAEGALLGSVGLNHLNPLHNLANLGYWVGEGVRGRGVATAAARLAARFSFDTLGLTRLEIVVLPNNAASLRVAEKLGAVREAEARNRVMFQGSPAAAIVYSLVPGDLAPA